ncbi:MAG: hypothetical protein WCG84_01435 [Candidatus Moraniibacteriota bacterium]
MSEIFECLFGSKSRARIVRLFVLNGEKEYLVEDVVLKTLAPRRDTTKILGQLKKIKLVIEHTRKGKKMYTANPQFELYPELRTLFSKPSFGSDDQAFHKIRGVGDVRLILVSGIFLNYPKSKADMILVANTVSRAKLKTAVAALEAEVGQEVRFVLMTLEEFQYRLNMTDRFLIEAVEQPHREVFNKLPEFKRFVAGVKKR